MSQSEVKSLLGNLFEAPGSGARMRPMEGMRGFAALLVFFVHFNALFHAYFQPHTALQTTIRLFGSFGHAGVDLFFLLSGYLIYGIVLEKHPPYFDFLWRRARRLYPVFFVVLIIYVGLSLAFPAESKIPHPLSRAILFVAANALMLPGMTKIVAIITVAWSLSYEWFFYITMPLVIAITGLRRWRSWPRIWFFLLLAAAQIALTYRGMDKHDRLIMFVAGIVLWELVAQGREILLKPWMEYVATAAFVANLVVIGIAGTMLGERGEIFSPIAHLYSPSLFVTLFFFSACAMFYNGFLNRLFSYDYLRWCGNVSYSYYLIHGLVLHGVRIVVERYFPPAARSSLFGITLLLVSVLSTLFCAALLYLFVEKPLSWSRAARKRRPAIAPEKAIGTAAAMSVEASEG